MKRIENTFGREVAACLAFRQFFDACEGTSETLMDATAQEGLSHLPYLGQEEKEMIARIFTDPTPAVPVSGDFDPDDSVRARGMGIRLDP